MAGRSQYTEEDRAFVYVTLASNDGNVKRTSRDTGIPEQTVRRWKAEFDVEPPQAEAVQGQVDEHTGDMERVEKLALRELERKIRNQELRGSELIAAIGVLNDKRTRAKMVSPNTHTLQVKLPTREEVADLLGGAVATAIQAAGQRQEDIIDAGFVERKALPAAVFIEEE